jgi:hypothetical protein
MAPITPSTQVNNDDNNIINKKPLNQPPSETVEDLKRWVAVLEQEKVKEERARNYAQLERVR